MSVLGERGEGGRGEGGGGEVSVLGEGEVRGVEVACTGSQCLHSAQAIQASACVSTYYLICVCLVRDIKCLVSCSVSGHL